MAINSVVLMGRLVRDIELKSTASGIEYANFSIAVDRRYQSKDEDKQADFIDCVAWRQTAVFIGRYFQKGSMIALTGELQTRTYEDKNGNKRKAVEVVVAQASFCGGKNESSTGAEPKAAPSLDVIIDDDVKEIPSEDDLPF